MAPILAFYLGAMSYDAETYYLGVVGHGAEKMVQDGFLTPRGINIKF
jgi:hypothetical protein